MKAHEVQEGERELLVHHRRGVERIRLTGDPQIDAALRRFATVCRICTGVLPQRER